MAEMQLEKHEYLSWITAFFFSIFKWFVIFNLNSNWCFHLSNDTYTCIDQFSFGNETSLHNSALAGASKSETKYMYFNLPASLVQEQPYTWVITSSFVSLLEAPQLWRKKRCLILETELVHTYREFSIVCSEYKTASLKHTQKLHVRATCFLMIQWNRYRGIPRNTCNTV